VTDIDLLRQAAFDARIKGVPGGNRVAWSASDAAMLRGMLMELPVDLLRWESTAPVVASKLAARPPEAAKLAEVGISIRNAPAEDDLAFAFTISSSRVDLAGDSIDQNGIDLDNYASNPVVLAVHDSSQMPIATSTRPAVAGGKLVAVAKFPAPRVSFVSDRVAAAVRANLVKGASIGFVPLKWSLSKDPTRPMGVDFHRVRLLEWSICPIPCNADCVAIGAVTESVGRNDSDAIAARVREAQQLTDRFRRATGDQLAATTRAERLAEAERFRRIAQGR
jgi:hypothetical protein